jgi:2-polyprenyl-3-methyl-5-hydroxy-6-metoxy-1,4-benzoquinol methylase
MNAQKTKDWNARYLEGNTPWASKGLLQDVIHVIQKTLTLPASILEIGCGYAEEAIALSKAGYHVSAIDISQAAIDHAKKNAEKAGVSIDFHVANFMDKDFSFEPVDAILDVAVFHTFQAEDARREFAQNAAKLLKPGGLWFSVFCTSHEAALVAEKTGVDGPPVLTREEAVRAVQSCFDLEKVHKTLFKISRDNQLAEFPTEIAVFKRQN